MKDKAIDIVLLVILTLVALVIMWTLFTLTPNRAGQVSRQDVVPQTEFAQAEQAQAAANARNDAVIAVEPGADDADTTNEATTPATDDSDAQATVAIPEGATELEQIGFNSATGQRGACNVPIEPWKHIAVSRDFLNTYGCGANVTITLAKPVNGRSSVDAIIADTMGPNTTGSVVIYVPEDEPNYALQVGGALEFNP